MSSEDNTTGSKSKSSGAKGQFFAVDWRCVEDATKYGDGINTALAYVALARHTPRNQRTTIAGMTAIAEKAGLTRGRADLALKTLETAGLITRPTKGTARSLIPWGFIQAERAKLTSRQNAVLERVLSKKNPILSGGDPDYQVAYALTQKGILEPTNAELGKAKFRTASPDWVWLPNTLVDGFSDGDTPLSRLRQIQDARALPLLLDCYRLANLAEDGGLPWLTIRQKFRRHRIWNGDRWAVWGFVSDSKTAQWDPLVTRFLSHDPKAKQADGDKFWEVIGALEGAGLIEFVGHIVESLNPGAQAIHAYALPSEGEPEERAVADAAHKAGLRLIPSHKYEEAAAELGRNPWLCPVRSHVTNVELIGIARPVHRPQTRKTSAWARNFLHQCRDQKALFDSLGQSSTSSAA